LLRISACCESLYRPWRTSFLISETSIHLALRSNDHLFLCSDTVQLIHEDVDLAVGFFDLVVELFPLSPDGLRETLMEGEHHVHEGHQVIVQLLFAGLTEVDEANWELPQD